MKSFFTVMAFFLLGSFAQAETNLQQINPSEMYQKLQNLFESSNIPYPIEQVAMKKSDDSSHFSGCVYAPLDGTPYAFSPIKVVHYQITVDSGLGPLQPAKINTAYTVMYSDVVDQAIRAGGFFENGRLNMDNITFSSDSGAMQTCNVDFTADYFYRNSHSGLNPDGRSYDTWFYCPNGKRITETSARKSDDYLVARRYAVGGDDYFYCWR